MTAAFDYNAIRHTADALIAKFGTASAIRRVVNSGSDFDPVQTPTDYATTGVVTNLTRWYSAFANDNSDVLRTDRLGYVSMGPLIALGVTRILPNDVFVHGGAAYQIIDAKPVAPAGSPVVYILQLRV